jgi:hypothetical protein
LLFMLECFVCIKAFNVHLAKEWVWVSCCVWLSKTIAWKIFTMWIEWKLRHKPQQVVFPLRWCSVNNNFVATNVKCYLLSPPRPLSVFNFPPALSSCCHLFI